MEEHDLEIKSISIRAVLMPLRHNYIVILLLTVSFNCFSQNYRDTYDLFKSKAVDDYLSFKDQCNQKYTDFLRDAWKWYEGKAPLPLPKDDKPVPPRPFDGKDNEIPTITTPVDVEPIEDVPQPKPVAPVREIPTPDEEYFLIEYYGVTCKVRLPEEAKHILIDCQPNSIAEGWMRLSGDCMNNAIRDCLETRIRYNLCDWAYLSFLDELCRKYCSDPNDATFLMAFLYCQSGYQMRLAVDSGSLVMLYGTEHQIYGKGYFELDGTSYYPWGDTSKSISICNAIFEGETPMSLYILKEQRLGEQMSHDRKIVSEQYNDVNVTTQVPLKLIEFYNRYPTSAIGGNPMTRWAMYANTPLSQKVKDRLYPALKESINGLSEIAAADKLLNWVQTGFVYEYDEKVWGHDRAFFAEESLYYQYCDCEDRSILFSRLVRDILELDVALIYYPGHLATAVAFHDDAKGDAMMIGGRKFIVCDPTYIGAPVGSQMPGLEYDKTQAIVLKK